MASKCTCALREYSYGDRFKRRDELLLYSERMHSCRCAARIRSKDALALLLVTVNRQRKRAACNMQHAGCRQAARPRRNVQYSTCIMHDGIWHYDIGSLIFDMDMDMISVQPATRRYLSLRIDSFSLSLAFSFFFQPFLPFSLAPPGLLIHELCIAHHVTGFLGCSHLESSIEINDACIRLDVQLR